LFEKQVLEEFEPYTPIAMANIWGLEEVLASRCINLVVDKSNNQSKTSLQEYFEKDIEINRFKSDLGFILVSLCRLVGQKNILYGWNEYILDYYTLTTHTTYTTQQNEENEVKKDLDFSVVSVYNKIRETGITGRNLELFFPIFLVANMIHENVFDKILVVAKEIVEQQKEDDAIESTDISLIEFVSKQSDNDYVQYKELTELFRMFLGDTDREDLWLNVKWIGRALKRLNLIKSKRRIGKGREVILNIEKAQEKMKVFK
jgi:hypothetical protein